MCSAINIDQKAFFFKYVGPVKEKDRYVKRRQKPKEKLPKNSNPTFMNIE